MKIEKNILIVDDKPGNLVALERILQSFDVNIMKATSGNEALTRTIEHDFALALIDVQMPDMDGFETVKLMRQVEKTRLLPVIFLTAIYSEDNFLLQDIDAGAVDFIMKPFNTKILQGKVKVFLDLYEQKKKLELEIEQRKATEAFLRETEKQLREAKRRAEESDKLKTAFLANISHEIRTPLTTIVGFAELLSEKEVTPPEKKQYYDFILKSSENLLTIINDILDVAKIEAGQLKINIQPVEINKLMREVKTTFSARLLRMNKNHIELIFLPPAEDEIILNTDEIRLRQILNNLLGNAAKFTLLGSIAFGYEIKDKQAEFFVQDTGIGIPEDKLDFIFDRFQKLENQVGNPSGTGIGLSIVKKLVSLLGGEIQVSSKINQGSRFSFTLPVSGSKGKDNKVKDGPVVLPHKFDWSAKNVLIVEDEPPTFILLQSILGPTGVKLKWAKNGEEALNEFKTNPCYDAILMDIKMQGLTGVETFYEIQKLNKKMPVIAHTAYAMSDDKERLQEIGFSGYVSKPIIRNELLSVLQTVLGQHGYS